MALRRRLCALMVVVALCAAMPTGAPRGCVTCAPHCPMHARDGHGHRDAKHLGCHRADVPLGVVCLRGTCGHEAVVGRTAPLLAVLVAPVPVADPPQVRAFAPRVILAASTPLAEPPTHPPRA
jgi:hypothetical protein